VASGRTPVVGGEVLEAENRNPEVEGYSYVNLSLATKLDSRGGRVAQTRGSVREILGHPDRPPPPGRAGRPENAE
jgi:hypothetical protein